MIDDPRSAESRSHVLLVAPGRDGDPVEIIQCRQGFFPEGMDRLTAAVGQSAEQRRDLLVIPAFVSVSLNNQIVFASGTLSSKPRPRKRMKLMRSLI